MLTSIADARQQFQALKRQGSPTAQLDAYRLAQAIYATKWSEVDKSAAANLCRDIIKFRFPEEERNPMTVSGLEIAAWCARHKVSKIVLATGPHHGAVTPTFLAGPGPHNVQCIVWNGTLEEVVATLGTLVLTDQAVTPEQPMTLPVTAQRDVPHH